MTIDSLTPVVTVKPLEWEYVAGKIWDARALGGIYRVRFEDGAWVAFKYGDTFRADREAEEEAKAEAQKDWERRVLSCLILPDASQAPRSGYSQTTEVREITEANVDEYALALTKRIEREFYYDHPGGAVQVRAKAQALISEAIRNAQSKA